MSTYLSISSGLERIMLFVITFLFLTHIGACLWIIIAEVESSDHYEGTWMQQFYPEYQTGAEIYAISFYWTITTITTVGYGDITGKSILEYIFSSVVMVIGVVAFSYANGALASIISNYDH